MKMNWISMAVTGILAGLSWGIGMGIAALFVRKQKEKPAAFWLTTVVCGVVIYKLSEQYFALELTKWIGSLFP